MLERRCEMVCNWVLDRACEKGAYGECQSVCEERGMCGSIVVSERMCRAAHSSTFLSGQFRHSCFEDIHLQ